MNEMPVRVPVEELRRSFEVLMRRVEASAGDGVVLERDYFWTVAPGATAEVNRQPGADDLTIGQVSESWAQLRALLADEDRAVGHHLVWLADVLRAIGLEHPA
ncbi:hypothetical protein [Streptomyces sp. CBMA123]|uniref:hypothetical protein n=1 Tax=Streptomyces sp. CBMA123 TaxID=1896313 RepID=UPI0016620D0D|nr:hypothetical protein [Streptomyces sp. CBMA123]MBD0691972.1 hypothetical protein [Streptomyces sp. CBMA123]